MLKEKKWSNEELEIKRFVDKAETIGRGIRLFEHTEGRKEGLEEGIRQGIRQGREEGRKEGEKSGLLRGREQGRKEGEKSGLLRGEHRKALEVAENLFKLGLTSEQISASTGLTLKEIEKLKK